MNLADRLYKSGIGAALKSDLHDSLTRFRCGDDGIALRHTQAHRLLSVEILARSNYSQIVCIVQIARQCADHGVDAWLRKQFFPPVGLNRSFAACLDNGGGGAFSICRLDVAYSAHGDVGELQQTT